MTYLDKFRIFSAPFKRRTSITTSLIRRMAIWLVLKITIFRNFPIHCILEPLQIQSDLVLKWLYIDITFTRAIVAKKNFLSRLKPQETIISLHICRHYTFT